MRLNLTVLLLALSMAGCHRAAAPPGERVHLLPATPLVPGEPTTHVYWGVEYEYVKALLGKQGIQSEIYSANPVCGGNVDVRAMDAGRARALLSRDSRTSHGVDHDE